MKTVRDACQVQANALSVKLTALQPFHWELEYPDVFLQPDGSPRPEAESGFDGLLGNPPYISTHTSSAEQWRAAYDDVPERERHLAMHYGHLVLVHERDRPFVTPQLIQGFGMALDPAAWREKLAALEQDGATEIAYQPAGPDIPGELEAFASAAGAG